jgi:hypothetical protein
MAMKNALKLIAVIAALLVSYYSGQHYGFIDGVLEARADCIMNAPMHVKASQPAAF